MQSIINKDNIKEAYALGKNGSNDFNCWGATLFALNKNTDLYWTSQKTMNEFLQKETEKVFNKIKIGDILALYNKREGLLHTAVYIGRNKFFHKRGSNKAEYVTEQEIKNIYHEYESFEFRRIYLQNQLEFIF